ncbi:B76 [Murid betaherpesvirus 8]|uniref:B76 n=2 Tax=Rat cytomegalovirus (isolate England) TaxID=1261657 RepID=K7XR21_RCMVE|nr:E76 [Murid betaherpesvirus 8]AKE44243.1 a76 [Rat cytomegalovirus ALL-03]AFX83391.1 E76 [Murid betaherpesvirus 8]AKB93271.1 B76 [Murid betaherpesvirus 8]WEG71863.1 nuclear protein UL24 [Murid betaherpesvirus 8]WPH24986.1 B76 [Murid betaherpesvirus 8]
MASAPESQLLSYLPECRKRVGHREHKRIYRKISSVFSDRRELNRVLGGVLPDNVGLGEGYVFYEVNLRKRIPDCVLVFVEDDGTVNCYVVEFKTTMRSADSESIHANKTHRFQYLQGLRQLRDSLQIFCQFSSVSGTDWNIYPVIAFFKQRGSTVSFSRTFRPKVCKVCTPVVLDYVRSQQDESVKNLSRFAVYRGVRSPPRKRSRVPSRGTRTAPRRGRVASSAAGGGSGTRRKTSAQGRRRFGRARKGS